MRTRRQRGMTMMEVMMAIVIATVGLFGSLAMMSLLFRSSSYTRNLSEAMSLVQARLELEISRPVTTSSPADGAGAGSPETLDGLGVANASGLYTRTTTWSTDGVRRKVNVAVAFTDNYGTVHTVYAERERNTP
jgi:prepilin-type N-terminal cleavage/methylation domain-containing protein